MTKTDTPCSIRLDKWLWAARLYKTRSIAKTMIDGGKIHYDGHRVKPSKEVSLNAIIRLRQGVDEKTIVVTGLSDKRGKAETAARLYQETSESINKREQTAAQRKLLRAAEGPGIDHRPNKKQRRQIIKFNQNPQENE